MKILIVSSSLNPDSKSRLLAQELETQWQGADFEVATIFADFVGRMTV